MERIARRWLPEPGIRGRQGAAGWLFLSPVIIILGLFLVLPIVMAAWVSVSDWTGNGSPFGSNVHWVGLHNYRQLLTVPGLDESNFGTALRNNFYYVILVVPTQTAVSLFLAVLVTRRLRFVGFFRTAFYFPSVTSSVAITVLFLFLFNPSGAINKLLSYVGVTGPSWFYDPRGLFHVILGQFGVHQPTGSLAHDTFLGVTYWDWLAGPSIAMCVLIMMAIFTTSGTFMLSSSPRCRASTTRSTKRRCSTVRPRGRKFRYVTVPMIRPTIFTVVTLGLIGTWQVFDQIYVGTKGTPAEHDPDARVPVLQHVLQRQRMGRRRGDRIHPLRDHRPVYVVTRLATRNPTACRDAAASGRRSRSGPRRFARASAGGRQ